MISFDIIEVYRQTLMIFMRMINNNFNF